MTNCFLLGRKRSTNQIPKKTEFALNFYFCTLRSVARTFVQWAEKTSVIKLVSWATFCTTTCTWCKRNTWSASIIVLKSSWWWALFLRDLCQPIQGNELWESTKKKSIIIRAFCMTRLARLRSSKLWEKLKLENCINQDGFETTFDSVWNFSEQFC